MWGYMDQPGNLDRKGRMKRVRYGTVLVVAKTILKILHLWLRVLIIKLRRFETR